MQELGNILRFLFCTGQLLQLLLCLSWWLFILATIIILSQTFLSIFT